MSELTRVKFERIIAGAVKSPNPLRDETVVGMVDLTEIRIDKPVLVFAAPRDAGNARIIKTSHVVMFTKNNDVYTIDTETGSQYRISVITEDEDGKDSKD